MTYPPLIWVVAPELLGQLPKVRRGEGWEHGPHVVLSDGVAQQSVWHICRGEGWEHGPYVVLSDGVAQQGMWHICRGEGWEDGPHVVASGGVAHQGMWQIRPFAIPTRKVLKCIIRVRPHQSSAHQGQGTSFISASGLGHISHHRIRARAHQSSVHQVQGTSFISTHQDVLHTRSYGLNCPKTLSIAKPWLPWLHSLSIVLPAHLSGTAAAYMAGNRSCVQQ